MAFLIYFAFISQHIDTAKFTKGLFEPESDFWAPSRAPGHFCRGFGLRTGLPKCRRPRFILPQKRQGAKHGAAFLEPSPLRRPRIWQTALPQTALRANKEGGFFFRLSFPYVILLYIRYESIGSLLMKTDALAQMGTASCCPGVRDNRYSGQLEIAPKYSDSSLTTTSTWILYLYIEQTLYSYCMCFVNTLYLQS